MSILEKLCQVVMNYCARKGKVFWITGTAGADDIYLIRYYIIKSRFFNLFLHEFLRSDRDDLHDHPWHFGTFLVRGAYTEQKFNPKTGLNEITRRTTDQNRLVFRKATDLHRVVVDRDLTYAERDQSALTIFFSGPTIRDWGFVQEVPLSGTEVLLSKIEADMYAYRGKLPTTKRVWVNWKKYLGLPEDAKSRG